MTARLAFHAAEAVETLGRLREHDQASARLGAANAILDQTLRWRDAEHLEARLSAFELIVET